MRPLIALSVMLLAGPFWASTALGVSIWDGGGSDANWTTALNWGAAGSDGVPSDDGTAAIQFGGSTGLAPYVDTNDPWSVATIVFNSGAGAFTIGGNEISIQGSGNAVQNLSSSTQTFAADVQVTGGGKTFVSTSGHIVIDGALDLQASVTARGGRNLTINGPVSGPGGISRTDSGVVKLTDPNNSFAGNVSVSHGVLETASIADAGVNSAIGAGSVISLGQGTWGPSDTGTLRYTGATASTNRAIRMTSNGTTQGSATLPFSGRPTIEITDPNTTLTFNGDFAYNGSSTLGQWRLRGAGTGIINGNITTDGARLEKAGTGTWIINGSSNHTGITEVLDGTLVIGNASALGTTDAGTTVAAGAVLELNGVSTAEAITVDGGTLRNLTALGTVTGTLTLASDSFMVVNNTGAYLALQGQITGPGGFTTSGNRTLRLHNTAKRLPGFDEFLAASIPTCTTAKSSPTRPT